jgi:NAD(P)-dependent dehydrogenase (short-subunit alcohol dehydrogenase family)
MNKEFSGKSALVTGAGRGIGRGCALALAAGGASVTVVSRSVAELESVVAEIRAVGGEARAIGCDVTSDAELERLFSQLERCDVLVNNAGGNQPEPFLAVKPGTLDRLLQLNVRSMFLCAQHAARQMVAQGGGVIINMSSQMGHVGAANRTVYCMTKHAIEGLTKAMAVELGPRQVRVNAVAPTYVETPLTKPFLEDSAFRSEVTGNIPLGRIGTVDEVVAAVMFLASPAASLITGTSLLVDGGYTAR